MKRKFWFILPAVLASLAGCGEQSGGGDSGKMEIIFWHNANTTTEGVLKSFASNYTSKINPDVTIKVEKHSGSYDDLVNAVRTGLAAGEKGNYPDLFYGYPDAVADLFTTGKVVRLDQFIDDPEIGLTEEDKDDYIEKYWDEGKHYQLEGTYSLPFAKSTEAMYYNHDLLGMTFPGVNDGRALNEEYMNSLTWEELFENLAPAILTKNALPEDQGGQFLDTSSDDYAVISYSSDDNMFITLCEQYGYPYTSKNGYRGSVDFNNAQVKAMLKKLNGYKKNHYLITNGTYGAGKSYTNELFTNRKTLFDIGSTGGGQYYAGDNNKLVNVRIAKIPTAKNTDKKVIMQGPSIAILQKGTGLDRPREAWKFYKYMTDKTNASNFARNTGYSPIRDSVYNNTDWIKYSTIGEKPEKSLNNVLARIATYTPTITDDLFTSPVFKGSNECRVQVESLLKSALALEVATDKAVQDLMDAAENAAKLKCN